MSTQTKYKDRCVLCGADLTGRTKLYWPAYRIREVRPEFRGEIFCNLNYGFPVEQGGYVCRSIWSCCERRKSAHKDAKIEKQQGCYKEA